MAACRPDLPVATTKFSAAVQLCSDWGAMRANNCCAEFHGARAAEHVSALPLHLSPVQSQTPATRSSFTSSHLVACRSSTTCRTMVRREAVHGPFRQQQWCSLHVPGQVTQRSYDVGPAPVQTQRHPYHNTHCQRGARGLWQNSQVWRCEAENHLLGLRLAGDRAGGWA